MKLSPPADKYDRAQQVQVQTEIARADTANRKKGAHIELGPTEYLILLSPNGTRYKLTVSNAGALSAVAL